MLFLRIVYQLATFVNLLNADIYLHKPRGSNNRLDENSNERRTANRLFDSENNNRGGYNVGFMYYYVDSQLQIEWTNQHSCKNENTNCDIIIQYMCSDNLRDGIDTSRIPSESLNCQNNDCESDLKYGMHEDYKYYRTCLKRARNKGLYTAGKSLPNSAMYTRQNPNGERSGYECAEERDYYPYWHPTPWIDIAILTDKPKKCEYYKRESENVKTRWYCFIDDLNSIATIPNNKQECEASQGIWREQTSHGQREPECRLNSFTRDNHLGDSTNGRSTAFNWTLPNNPHLNCALRIRYNISTDDYDTEKTNANSQVDIHPEYKTRGFVFKDNPEVKLFPGIEFKLKLAVNTAQYGRTFQDRSHRFEIRKRPISFESNLNVYNVNVRGKRGNIVQVYPGVEYDFVPNKLELSINDYVHFQWTGSNTNPLGNDGQGTLGTDRTNLVELRGSLATNYPKNLSNSMLVGLPQEALTNLALFNPNLFGSMEQLNDAQPYFDLFPQKINRKGIYSFMSTRNNAFSNRDQKATIISHEHSFSTHLFDSNGGVLDFSDGQLNVPKDSFDDLTFVRVDSMNENQIKDVNDRIDFEKLKDLASNFVIISADTRLGNQAYELKILLNEDTSKFLSRINSVHVYRIARDGSLMTKLDASFDGSYAKIVSHTYEGIYVATKEQSYGLIIGILVSLFAIAVLIIVLVIFLRRNPSYMHSLRYRVTEAKRTLLPRI